MKLISIAKLLYNRANDSNLFVLYDSFMKSKILEDIRNVMSPGDIVKTIFLAREIGEKRNPEELLPKLDNIFIFSIIEFGDNENWIECRKCNGHGEYRCDYCDDGSISCDTCDESGVVECEECGGEGELVDGETCDGCDGSGEQSCQDCGGDGYVSCPECRGRGYVGCEECDGEGEVISSDYIEYTIYTYASINQNLLTTLEKNWIRNKPFLYAANDETSFILDETSAKAGDGDTESVKHEFMNETYLNGIENSLDTLRITGRQVPKIIDFTLNYPDNKFLD